MYDYKERRKPVRTLRDGTVVLQGSSDAGPRAMRCSCGAVLAPKQDPLTGKMSHVCGCGRGYSARPF